MDAESIKRYFRTHSNGDINLEFPTPKPPANVEVFSEGEAVIVTTYCEDIALHHLTGTVSSISNRTGSVIVRMDADDSLLPFRPHELGHRQ